MKEENLLRLSMIVKAGQTSTFNSSLIKLIAMTLYDSESYSLPIDTLRENIYKSYELEFTNEEIKNAIKRRDCGIIQIKEEKKTVIDSNIYRKEIISYKLDEKFIQKYKSNEESNTYNSIISDFINRFSIDDYSHEQIEDILNRFLYNIFNSNKKTLLLLLRSNGKEISSNPELREINENEKKIINEFLNWDNIKKNEFIYNAVAYCVDYCMMTVKKDYSSFNQLFSGKVFYLDANVIFRMAGLNNEERKEVTNSFVNKCADSGIEIRYTNFTYNEIKDTVKKLVDILKKVSGGKQLVNVSHWREFAKPNSSMDLIIIYKEWCKKKLAKYNDFEAFNKYILKQIDNILRNFKKVDLISYSITDKPLFESLCQSLKEFKSCRCANFNNNSINTDVNNYLYILKSRHKYSESNFLDISEYLISTDGNLCDWGKDISPSAVPISVLPSVWHSLILKFKGRTNEDYKAFTLFLNLRYRMTDNDFDERKPEILNLVQNLEEPVELKNSILDEISHNLTSKYIDVEEVEEIVEDARNEVIQREINKIHEEEGKPLIEKGKKEGIEAGKQEVYNEIAEKKANKKICRYRNALKTLNVARVTFGMISIIGIIFFISKMGLAYIVKIFKIEYNGYDLLGWTTIIGIFFNVISFFIISPLKNYIDSLDFDKIKEKELKKLLSN